MAVLAAQAAVSGEWRDGWWMLIAGVCLAVAGLLVRVFHAGLKEAITEEVIVYRITGGGYDDYKAG